MQSSTALLSAIIALYATFSTAAPVTYQYDQLHRLTQTSYSNGTVISYTYDPAGNMLAKVITIDTDGDGLFNDVDLDDDNDGLTDDEEIALGTNPLNPDTDGDGDLDGDEVAYGSDPNLITDTLDDHRPLQPLLNPIAAEVPLTGLEMIATPFSDPDPVDILGADQWQISLDAGFTELLLERLRVGGEALDAGATLPVPDGVLDPLGYSFWVRLRHSDDRGLWSYWSTPVEFLTPSVDVNDPDGDGRPDAYQIDYFTDLNADGVDDSLQDIWRVLDIDQDNEVGFAIANAAVGTQITTLAPVSPLEIPEVARPNGFFPYGLFRYTVGFPEELVLDPQNPETVDIDIYFDAPIESGTVWVMFDTATGTVTDISTEVTVVGNKATLSVTDGMTQDLDGIVNHYLVDPLGPMIPVSQCQSDFDQDGDVDGSDLASFSADFGRTDCLVGDPCEGDMDEDGDVDGSDLAVFSAEFGRTDCL